MKIEIGKLVLADQALSELGKLQLVAKSSLKIARIIRAVSAEMQLFEKQRVECASKYGKLNEEKQMYELGDNTQKFNDEMTELAKAEIEVAIEKLQIADLEGAKVTPLTLSALDWLIDDAPTPSGG